jgi:ACR3 family arsenite efflux pump ArsB
MEQAPGKHMNVFERYLSLWVAAGMTLGVVIGKVFPGIVAAVRDLQFDEGEPDQHPDCRADLAE